jgi:large subunit ribosomal protein L10
MLMSAINGPAQKLAATLQAYVEKLEKEGPASAAPAAEAPKAEEAAPAAEAPAEA